MCLDDWIVNSSEYGETCDFLVGVLFAESFDFKTQGFPLARVKKIMKLDPHVKVRGACVLLACGICAVAAIRLSDSSFFVAVCVRGIACVLRQSV